jgi:hypothetical protein
MEADVPEGAVFVAVESEFCMLIVAVPRGAEFVAVVSAFCEFIPTEPKGWVFTTCVSFDCEVIGAEVPSGAVLEADESEIWRIIVAELVGAIFTALVS